MEMCYKYYSFVKFSQRGRKDHFMMVFRERPLHFLRDSRAVAAIEFAIVFPVFLFVVFFIMELSLICFSAITIENAVAESTRLAKVSLTNGTTLDDTVRQAIRDRSYGLINPARLSIVSTVDPNAALPTNFNDIAGEDCVDDVTQLIIGKCPCAAGDILIDSNGNGSCDAPGAATGASLNTGNPGDIVRYTVAYRWRVLTPLVPISNMVSSGGISLTDANGDLLLVSGGAVRNEGGYLTPLPPTP